MIICTVDRDYDLHAITVMLTDTSYSGGFARIDAQNNVVDYLVRYNNGAKLTDAIEGYYHVNEALQQAVYEVADFLAFDASNHDNNCNYDTVYTRLRDIFEFELNLC